MNRFLGRRMFKSIVGIELTGKDVLAKLLWLRKRSLRSTRKPIKYSMSTGI